MLMNFRGEKVLIANDHHSHCLPIYLVPWSHSFAPTPVSLWVREGFKNPSHRNPPLTFFQLIFWQRIVCLGGEAFVKKNPLKIGTKMVYCG